MKQLDEEGKEINEELDKESKEWFLAFWRYSL
ncbi:Protein of unknown function [Bacillus cytotoxicus]|uniref:Uncharacterized protein n=1 Tax=Bacillus cytotoxicus TaxID=580165 RepID=A0AAX2CD82_9BACI|nr:Protein of unknown function [Bacillus cytotoxicus]SCN31805.1 Protein of unknown function [Bacillus cytotoxicus]